MQNKSDRVRIRRAFYSALIFLYIIFGQGLFAQPKTWTMKECIDYALEKNIQLNQTQLTSKLNDLSLAQARANLYPNLALTDYYSLNFGYSTNTFTYQSGQQDISINNMALTSNFTIFNGFELRNTVKQSKYIYDAGNFDIEKAKNDILLAVVADYLQILYSYKALEIARSQVSNTATQAERTRKFVDAGKLAEGNLLQIQSQLSTDKASAVSAENQVQLAKVTLMQMMELPIVENFEIDSSGIVEPSLEAVTSSADIYRVSEGIMPEIRSAELKTQAAEAGIRIANASYLPRLTLGLTLKSGYSSGSRLYSTMLVPQKIGYLQNDPATLVYGDVPITSKHNYPFTRQLKDNFGQVINLNLTVPIYSNSQARYGSERAKIDYMNSQLSEQATRDQLRKLVEQAYTDLTAAIKNYVAAQEILVSEERTYRDMERKFNLGLATATDFLIEKDNYVKAQLSVVQSRFTYIFKSKIVDFYLGKNLN